MYSNRSDGSDNDRWDRTFSISGTTAIVAIIWKPGLSETRSILARFMWEFPRGRVCFPVNLAAVFIVMRFSQEEGWLCTEERILLLCTVQVDHILHILSLLDVSWWARSISAMPASICSLRGWNTSLELRNDNKNNHPQLDVIQSNRIWGSYTTYKSF